MGTKELYCVELMLFLAINISDIVIFIAVKVLRAQGQGRPAWNYRLFFFFFPNTRMNK